MSDAQDVQQKTLSALIRYARRVRCATETNAWKTETCACLTMLAPAMPEDIGFCGMSDTADTDFGERNLLCSYMQTMSDV